MSFDVREIIVNTDVRLIWNPTFGIRAYGDLIPRFFYKEIMIIGASFVNSAGNPLTNFVAGDQFELSIDVDFAHTILNGVLAQPYSGAVTSIQVTFTQDPGLVRTTGELVLRNDAYQRENVSYTDVSGTGVTRTFTVSKTLSFAYEAGDFAGIEDLLMVRVDNDGVDIPGDWTPDRANGKVAFRLDCSRYEFLRKIAVNGLDANNELLVNFEIKRYPDGETVPTVLCQDTVYARNIVRDLES